jgi:CRISPR-associated exonuclease Cas4
VSAFILALLFLGVLLLVISWRLRRSSGVPLGDIAYSDTDRPAQSLISERYGLVGKPDYIVVRDGVPIPVEVKPNRSAAQPYESDRLQLASYCLLIEETEAKTPPYGILKYREQAFRIDYTPALRKRLVQTLEEMRVSLGADDVGRSHESAARCAACGVRRSCSESLVE